MLICVFFGWISKNNPTGIDGSTLVIAGSVFAVVGVIVAQNMPEEMPIMKALLISVPLGIVAIPLFPLALSLIFYIPVWLAEAAGY